MKGGKPTRVGRVRRGGSAEEAGLRAEDVLLKVQESSTYQHSCASVARLVRFDLAYTPCC